jgi:glycosyltransferase involved in cell wall biosynthesis
MPEKSALPRPQKKIALFLKELTGGGTERMSLNLLAGLNALGYETILVVAMREGELWPLVPKQTEIICFGASGGWGSLTQLIRFLRRRKPDVLIASLGYANLIALWAKLLARAKTKVVIREHSKLFAIWRWPKRSSDFHSLLYRMFGRFADAAVAVSDEVADVMAHVTGIDRRAIAVISNPVITEDFETFSTAPVDHPFFKEDGIPVFIGVGRLAIEKDFQTLISAFAIFRAERPARLMFLGTGELLAALQAQCSSLGIDRDVAFLGYVQNPLPYMKHAAALVHPSRSEGFGNILVEALAAGTQIVCTDNSYGPRYILNGGEFGFLVPTGDPAAMAAAMKRAVDHPLPIDMGQKHARRFTAEAAAQHYADLIETLSQRPAA